MAKADIEVKVLMEKTIHNSLLQTLQKIQDDYGICISEISADWIDMSTPVSPCKLLRELSIESSSIQEHRNES